jgi:DivIVA domain-containing protein
VDGEIDETATAPSPESGGVDDDGQVDAEGQVDADRLMDYLRKAHFEVTRGRRGYQIAEVNAFLNRLVELVEAGQPLARAVRKQRFTIVRLEHGYDPGQVDDFLEAAVDVDPHAHVRPDVARGGLIGKLFG